MSYRSFPHQIELQDTNDSQFHVFTLKIPKTHPCIERKPHKLRSIVQKLKLTLPLIIGDETDKSSIKVRALVDILDDLTMIEEDIQTMKEGYLQINKLIATTKT